MTDTTAPIDQVLDLLRQLHLPHMRRQAKPYLSGSGETVRVVNHPCWARLDS